MNTIHIMGHVGKDADLSYTPTGTAVAKFSLADSLPAKPGEDRPTTWWNIIVWDKLAESAAKYIKKGSQVYIVGRCQPRAYTTKDGRQGIAFDVIAQTYFLTGSKPPTPDSEPKPTETDGESFPF